MRIEFRLKDERLELDINLSWNVLFLKQRACLEFNVDSQSYFLSLNGFQLNDWDRLSECNLYNNCLVFLFPYVSINHFFVLCYKCNMIISADINFICTVCNKNDFDPFSAVGSFDVTSLFGKCRTNACAGETASVLFKCSVDATHEPVVFLKHMKRNLDHETCIACCGSNCEVVVTFCDEKGHILCLSCFQTYAECYLKERKFSIVPAIGYTLQCPVGCLNAYISDTHHFRILGRQFYSDYKLIAAKQLCYSDKFVNCPSCDMCWELPNYEGGNSWVLCEGPLGCGVEFCTHCRNLVQRIKMQVSQNCSNFCVCIQSTDSSFSPKSRTGSYTAHSWNGVNLSPTEIASNCLISNTCKSCPNCRSKTNKDGGCNHIHCTVCGSDWCWICIHSWSNNCEISHWF